MKTTAVFLLLLVTLGRCTQNNAIPAEASADALVIRTGTSFGFCVGYCQKEYVFTETGVTLTQTSRSPTQPVKTCQATLSQAAWNALKAAANVTLFSKQPETLGCPDCADGGAEYIELQTGDQKHRVTFEFGKTIPGLEPLVNALRNQRNQFTECK